MRVIIKLRILLRYTFLSHSFFTISRQSHQFANKCNTKKEQRLIINVHASMVILNSLNIARILKYFLNVIVFILQFQMSLVVQSTQLSITLTLNALQWIYQQAICFTCQDQGAIEIDETSLF